MLDRYSVLNFDRLLRILVIVPRSEISRDFLGSSVNFNTKIFSNNKSEGRGAKALAIRNNSINSPLFFAVIELSKYFTTAFNDAGVCAETNASINVNLEEMIVFR